MLRIKSCVHLIRNILQKPPGGDGSAGGGEDRQRDLQEPAHHEGRHHPRVQGSHHQGEPSKLVALIRLTNHLKLKVSKHMIANMDKLRTNRLKVSQCLRERYAVKLS